MGEPKCVKVFIHRRLWWSGFPIEYEFIDVLFPGQPPALLDADKTGVDKLRLEAVKAARRNMVFFGGGGRKRELTLASGLHRHAEIQIPCPGF